MKNISIIFFYNTLPISSNRVSGLIIREIPPNFVCTNDADMTFLPLEFFPLLSIAEHIFTGMNPAVADILRILTGTTAWIGGLTLFMWIREKKKRRAIADNQTV